MNLQSKISLNDSTGLSAFRDLHTDVPAVLLQVKLAQPAVSPDLHINNKYYEEICPQ